LSIYDNSFDGARGYCRVIAGLNREVKSRVERADFGLINDFAKKGVCSIASG
jgi:hypothetical protein